MCVCVCVCVCVCGWRNCVHVIGGVVTVCTVAAIKVIAVSIAVSPFILYSLQSALATWDILPQLTGSGLQQF